MTHITVTGTQRGTTLAQRTVVARILEAATSATDLHHGDCDGADREIDDIARRAGYRIHLHIPDNDSKRAFCEVREGFDVIYPPLPYLARNRVAADAGSLVLATPWEMVEQIRSGTWSTVRYARRRGKVVLVVYPDGGVGA